jgi:hypothetical protein
VAKSVLVFAESNGVNNESPDAKLLVNYKTGASDLRDSYNCIFDTESGNIKRRKGWTLKLEFSDARSIITYGAFSIFACLNILYKVDKDFVFEILTENLTVGENGETLALVGGVIEGRCYITNGTDYLYINQEGCVNLWALPPEYIGPVTDKTFQDPPENIESIEAFAARLLCAVGKWVFYSEKWDYGSFNLADCYWRFPYETTDVGRVGNSCVYVGTTSGVFAMLGADAASVERKFFSHDTMLKGSLKVLAISGPDNTIIRTAMWVGNKGIYVGDEQGNILCLSGKRFKFNATTVQWAFITATEYWCKFNEITGGTDSIYVNTTRKACGFFNGLEFDSVTILNNNVVGLNSEGFCTLLDEDSEDDNGEPIQAYFELPSSDFDESAPKRIRRAALNFWSDGDLMFTVRISTGAKEVIVVSATYDTPFAETVNVTVPRMLPSTNIGYGVCNTDGCDFMINSISVLPIVVPSRSRN